jgi:hypothetical protein
MSIHQSGLSCNDRHEAKAIEMAKDGDMNVRPTLTRMMIRNPDPRTRRIALSCFRSWTLARLALFPEPEGSAPGPSRLVASNEALAAAHSSGPTTHALP